MAWQSPPRMSFQTRADPVAGGNVSRNISTHSSVRSSTGSRLPWPRCLQVAWPDQSKRRPLTGSLRPAGSSVMYRSTLPNGATRGRQPVTGSAAAWPGRTNLPGRAKPSAILRLRSDWPSVRSVAEQGLVRSFSTRVRLGSTPIAKGLFQNGPGVIGPENLSLDPHAVRPWCRALNAWSAMSV